MAQRKVGGMEMKNIHAEVMDSLLSEAKAIYTEYHEHYGFYGLKKQAGFVNRARNIMARVLEHDTERTSYALQYMDNLSVRLGKELQRV